MFVTKQNVRQGKCRFRTTFSNSVKFAESLVSLELSRKLLEISEKNVCCGGERRNDTWSRGAWSRGARQLALLQGSAAVAAAAAAAGYCVSLRAFVVHTRRELLIAVLERALLHSPHRPAAPPRSPAPQPRPNNGHVV